MGQLPPLQNGFLWHDIGRILLSLTLREDRLDLPKIAAFREGYASQMPLTIRNIADALRIVWYVEAPWWIQPEVFSTEEEKLIRFRKELCRLTTHWTEPDSLLQESGAFI